MKILANRGQAAAWLVASATILPGAVMAQAPVPPVAPSPVHAAMAMTRDRGVPAVVVVASRRDAASMQLGQHLAASDWARDRRGLVQVVVAVVEDNPQLVASLKVTQYPTAIVYCRGTKGLASYQTTQDCASVDSLCDWLGRLVDSPRSASKPAGDPGVIQASHGANAYPSNQGYTPPAPQSYSSPSSVPATMSMPASTGFAAPMSTMASVIQMPGQSFMIQQQAPQVFVAPAQAPVIYVPQGMASAPSGLASMPSGMASAPAGNMFLPAGNPGMAPSGMAGLASMPAGNVAAGPMMGIAAGPMMGIAAGPTMGIAAVAAQPSGIAAVTNQQLNLPTSNSRTRVRIRGAGPVASAASRFGERLTRLGRARIETTQETTLEAPLTQSGSPGMTTISTTSAVPIAQPQPTIALAGRPVCPPPVAEVPVERPSPQGPDSGPKHH